LRSWFGFACFFVHPSSRHCPSSIWALESRQADDLAFLLLLVAHLHPAPAYTGLSGLYLDSLLLRVQLTRERVYGIPMHLGLVGGN
jgi:hypothetical protein